MKNNNIYKLIDMAEETLTKKCDFFEICKSIDQFRLLKKLLLNEGQCLLIKNRELKTLTNETELDSPITNDQLKKDIIQYIKSRKDSGSFNQIDKVLMNYATIHIKESIKSDLNL